MKRFIFIIMVTVVFFSCTSAPSVPPFSFFDNYPTEGSTLTFFRTIGGDNIRFVDTCIITNPADLEELKSLSYDDPSLFLPHYRKWRLDFNAVTLLYDIGVVRSDIAMFNLPNDIKEVGIFLYGGVGAYGQDKIVQSFILQINHDEKRQGFVFTLENDSNKTNINRLSNNELEEEYRSFYKRYAFQNDKKNKSQIGFIVR